MKNGDMIAVFLCLLFRGSLVHTILMQTRFRFFFQHFRCKVFSVSTMEVHAVKQYRYSDAGETVDKIRVDI